MKNRKGQTLEQPYLDIAMMRREQQEWREGMKVRYKKFEETQLLINAFYWEETPEKYDWWHEVYIGKTPDIPASSLAELEAWRKAKATISKNGTVEPDYKAMYDELAGMYKDLQWTFSELREQKIELEKRAENAPDTTDYKAMYEDLLDKLEFYKKAFEGLKTTVEQNLHTAELQSTERNYVWEAALAAMQGFIASYAGAAKNPGIDTVAGISLTYAESLVAEGKKRKLI